MVSFDVEDVHYTLAGLIDEMGDTETLFVLALVSRGFRRAAQAKIFQSFIWVHESFVWRITCDGRDGLPDPTSVEWFAERTAGVLSAPHLRIHIRALEIHTCISSYTAGQLEDRVNLELLGNTLDLWADSIPTLSLISFTLYGIPVFPRLHHALALNETLRDLHVHGAIACQRPCPIFRTAFPSSLEVLEIFPEASVVSDHDETGDDDASVPSEPDFATSLTNES